MDDDRIQKLTAEVMAQIGGASKEETADLEARVSALERALARVEVAAAPGMAVVAAAPSVAAVAITTASAPRAMPLAHPALRLLDVPGGGDRCVLDPDRPCVDSGTCRTLGH